MPNLGEQEWSDLSRSAWEGHSRARVLGRTSVGAAVLSDSRRIHIGCNVEHKFRSHDVHAEVNALTNMLAAGDSRAIAVLVVSERERFTPCGACLDWIFELGGADTLVGFQDGSDSEPQIYRADELMPFYPR